MTANQTRFRNAFTMWELLLVIAILGVALGIVVPSVRGSLSNEAWRQTTGGVTAFCDSVRAKAIESGEIYWLRYAEGESVLIAGADQQGMEMSLTLSEGFVFEPGIAQSEHLDPQLMGFEELEWSNFSWSQKIPFQPDGTAVDAKLQLVGPQQKEQTVLIRGLTGSAEVSATSAK